MSIHYILLDNLLMSVSNFYFISSFTFELEIQDFLKLLYFQLTFIYISIINNIIYSYLFEYCIAIILTIS